MWLFMIPNHMPVSYDQTKLSNELVPLLCLTVQPHALNALDSALACLGQRKETSRP